MRARVCVCACAKLRRKPPSASIHEAFGSRFRHLFIIISVIISFFFLFSFFSGAITSLAVDYKQKDLTAIVCLAPCDPSLHVSFSAGISLLVPHGGITEDTTWEMYMIISQEDSR